jgi:hypothetical protein
MYCLNEFVFPVSGRILLLNLQRPLTKAFPNEIVMYVNNAIIERAQRFVACRHKELLKALVEQYKVYVQAGKNHLIIPELFYRLQPYTR